MFPYPIANPQNCDIQTFYGNDTVLQSFTWNKPIAASHVYMLLIGGGGAGDGTNGGGGSGVVTVWYGAAQNVPNTLVVTPASAANGNNTNIYYRGTSLVTLITANTANGYAGAGASSDTAFTYSGFFKSVAGQDGVTGAVSPSTTSFLSGGGASSNAINANYGYTRPAIDANKDGYFLLNPIIVGVGGQGISRGGIGCGGGLDGGIGGSGMVLIASW